MKHFPGDAREKEEGSEIRTLFYTSLIGNVEASAQPADSQMFSDRKFPAG